MVNSSALSHLGSAWLALIQAGLYKDIYLYISICIYIQVKCYLDFYLCISYLNVSFKGDKFEL